MSEPGAEAVVCAVADPEAELAAVGWRLAGEPEGLLLADGTPLPARAELEAGPGGARLRLDAGEARCELDLSPARPPDPLVLGDGAAPQGGPRASICAGSGRCELRGDRRKVSAAGVLTIWDQDPLEGVGTLRQLTVPAGEGASLLAIAAGAAGAAGHGEERTGAWRVSAEGAPEPYGEALLSTQYGGSGSPARFGLELWPTEEGLADRAAGTAIGGIEAGSVSAAILRTSAEGVPGLGVYVIWRG